ncbi:MAG: efflux RND transporter permease subunit [Myxococcota bacterium]
MRSVIAWLVDHGTTIAIAVICLFLAGMLSYVTLPRESNPDITIPVVLVSTPYVGVSPEDIEGLITIPLENELAGLRDVKVMKSTSAEGVSIVSIEFEPDVVIEDALQKVRDQVSKAKPKLPEDAEEPGIQEISFSDIPIVLITIAGDVGEAKLKELGDKLQEEATRIPGVLDARITGGVDREIWVDVYPERLAHYGLALYDVTGAIADENVNIPGGTVGSGDSSFLLRVPGEFKTPQQIADVAIKRVGDRPVFVRDIARVVDGTSERKTYSRMNGRPSVTLSVTKRAGANILEVVQSVKDLANTHAESWPEGVSYRVLGDQSENIEASVTDLQNNILTALILVVSVIVFFMGVRNSLFVAAAIPLSMLASFMVLDMLGFTLNMVVLFSLMIALGMLVDNGIVVVENVFRHAEMGKSRREAAIDGTHEVAIAVAASTATTVAAFFPMVFWPGIMGEFMSFLPKTVIIVLVASLVVAIGFLPVFMARLMKATYRGTEEELDADPYKDLGAIMRGYKAVLLASIRFRYASLGLGVAALVFTFVAYIFLNHGAELFPETAPERANVFVRSAEGTDLEQTDRIVRQVEGILANLENVDVWVAEPGVVSDGNALGPSSAAGNQARITVDFLPDATTAHPGEKIRVEPTTTTIDRLRQAVAEIPGAEIRIEKERMGPPVGKPIGVEVSGPDFHSTGELALEVRRAIAKLDGVADLSDDYRVGRPEMRLRIDRGAAKRIGVSTAGIGNAVRTAVAGSKASALRDGEDEYDIVVRLAPEAREDLQSVLALRLPGREDRSPDTFAVPLSSVAGYSLDGGTGSVKHIDQDLVVTISGDVAEGTNEVEIQAAVKELIDNYDVPAGHHLRMGGNADEQAEASSFLLRAFFIACALILMVLVTQFDSIWIPGIILVTVVLSLIGVLWGLVITGTPFGIIMTGIGVISLAGVVVNNAIVLLDYVQQLESKGMEVREALVRAGITRFRPVMLTAITTTLGLVPMAIGVSVDFFTRFPVPRLVIGSQSAQWWGPMAIAVIFGLSFATVLTLVMVPTLYSIYDDFRNLGQRVRGLVRRPAPESDESVGEAATGVAKVVFGLLLAGGLASSAQAVTLDEAVAAAEGHSVSHGLLSEQTQQAGLQRYKAWSALSPRVEVGASYIVNEFAIELDFADTIPEIPGFEFPEVEPTVVQRKTFWTADATVSQRLFSGTALPALRSTFKAHQAAQLTESRERARLEVGVAQAFYGVLMAREAEGVASASLEAGRGQLELANRQVAAGIASERASLQARLAVAQGERDVLQAAEQRVRAEEAFHRMTGLERDAELELPESPSAMGSLSEAIGSIPGRPDLEAAELQIQAASLQHTASNMRWAPVVDAQFKYSYNQNTGFQDDPTSWQLALVGKWTLWDGGLRVAESAEYASRRRMAELQARQLRETAEEEVRVSWEALQRANRGLSAVDDELALADENVRLAERSFEVGAGTWLEVQQAQVMRQSAQLNAIQQRMNRDVAALQLQLATGRL